MKKIPFLIFIVPFLLLSCGTPKTEILWISEGQHLSNGTVQKSLAVFHGDVLDNEEWVMLEDKIDGLPEVPGYLRKIEVNKIKKKNKTQYVFVKELDREEDIREQLNGLWVLAGMNGKKIEESDAFPTLQIDLEELTFSANGGCNLINGTIGSLTTTGVHFGNAVSTMKSCPDMILEDSFIQMLLKVKKYQIISTTLRFYSQDGRELASFNKTGGIRPLPENDEPEKDKKMKEEVWINISIGDISTREMEKRPTLIVNKEEMRISGNDGCNQYFGPIKQFSNTRFELGEIAATKMMCMNMEIPDAFHKSLREIRIMVKEGERLEFLNDKGRVILSFEKQEER